MWRPPQRWRSANVETMVLELPLMLLLFLNCGGCENSLFRIIPGLAGDPCLGINYSGPNPCVAAGAIFTA